MAAVSCEFYFHSSCWRPQRPFIIHILCLNMHDYSCLHQFIAIPRLSLSFACDVTIQKCVYNGAFIVNKKCSGSKQWFWLSIRERCVEWKRQRSFSAIEFDKLIRLRCVEKTKPVETQRELHHSIASAIATSFANCTNWVLRLQSAARPNVFSTHFLTPVKNEFHCHSFFIKFIILQAVAARCVTLHLPPCSF